MKTFNELARAAAQIILEILRAIVQSLRYIFGTGTANDRVQKLDAELAQRDDERERESIEAAGLLREAARLEAATKSRQAEHQRAGKAMRTAQTQIGVFKITAIELEAERNSAFMFVESAGYKFQWRAPIDEFGKLVVDESMPHSLLDAINKSADPVSSLSSLTALIQAEVDRLMLARSNAAKRRHTNSSGIVQINSPSGRINWGNK